MTVGRLGTGVDAARAERMRIGYARVGVGERSLCEQVEALEDAGCAWIYIDVDTEADASREGLVETLTVAKPGDVLIVWKLDRVGRSLRHLSELVTALEGRGVGFRSLRERLDTSTPDGERLVRLLEMLAAFETDLLSTPEPRRRRGRPRALDEKDIALARRLFEDGHTTPKTICRLLGISRATLYRHVGTRGSRIPADSSSPSDPRS